MQNYLAYSILLDVKKEQQQQKLRAPKSGSRTRNITGLQYCDSPIHPIQRMIQRLGQFFDTCTYVLWIGMQHFKLSLI